ncbi:MAG: cytochrome d ubiquinol oxidase subunit II [Peptococcaceae bacterium]|nr:cytochrome d ubiquinol oxidase subunit II [Peptococcaceae bacterium]
MEIQALQLIWFLLAGVVLLGYAVLGGYDMGVGSLYLFNKSKSQRREMLASIGPYWDANQVWLITFGGGLFAAFPFVFSTVWSGFYLAMMLLLVGLILRTVAIEFRYQLNTPGWSKVFDSCFGIGSLLPSILFGAAMGNILRGIPLATSDTFAATKVYTAGFFDILNPYALAMGVFSLVLFMFHGANFLNATGKDDLRRDARKKAKFLWITLLALYVVVTAWTFISKDLGHLLQNFNNFPLFYAFPVITLLALIVYPLTLKDAKAKIKPLLASVFAIVGMIGTVAASLFPRLVPNLSTVDKYAPTSLTDFTSSHLADSLTISNAASSELTLTIMLVIAGIGVPTMLLYTIFVYRTLFKTKAAADVSTSAGVSTKA